MRIRGLRWWMISLLMLGSIINYLTRSTLGVAAQTLMSDLHITDSHSRPHVSNDNPYSEAHFKTLKYCPVFPGTFDSADHARAFCGLFFDYYNNEHRHSGIGLHTPQSVHDGTWREIRRRRQEVLDAAYAARPDRFRRPPRAPQLPRKTWINQPRPTIESQEDTAAQVFVA